jgi:hypothetical protein
VLQGIASRCNTLYHKSIGRKEENKMPKFPDVTVQLTGEDGNAFFIIGAVSKALKRAGHSEAAAEFQAEAMSGDYDHVLQTCMDYVDVH